MIVHILESSSFCSDKDKILLSQIKKIFESCNINFLIGSGFSANILDTLGNVELILEYVQQKKEYEYRIIEALTYWRFFQKSIYPIISINEKEIRIHIEFMKALNHLIMIRGNTTRRKRINIFTTNYDPVIEMACEGSRVIYNDGFEGRIDPRFCTSNFNRMYYSQTLFSDKAVEMPVFNLIKIHGSITWRKNSNDNVFVFSNMNVKIKEFYEKYNEFFKNLEEVGNELESIKSQKGIKKQFNKLMSKNNILFCESKKKECCEFIKEYKNSFEIINPTKEKFKTTIFNKTYHELLRIYANELEKLNSVLIVFGFSFKDEHILDITKRALGNPTLGIYIFAYKEEKIKEYSEMFESFNNVNVIALKNVINLKGKKDHKVKFDLEVFVDFIKSIKGN